MHDRCRLRAAPCVPPLFLDDNFVQCEHIRPARTVGPNGHIEQHAIVIVERSSFRSRVPRRQRINNGLTLDIGEITQHPDIDSDDWYGGAVERANGAQHCSVSSNGHQCIDRRHIAGNNQWRIYGGKISFVSQNLHVPLGSPLGHGARHREGIGSEPMDCEAERSHGSKPTEKE